MNQLTTVKPKLGSIGALRRHAISVSKDSLVRTTFLETEGRPPLLVEPTIEGVNPASWLARHREELEAQLLKHGGLLFRGFRLQGVDDFEQFIKAMSAELLEYSYQSTPRSAVAGQIYTSTEYPAAQTIPLHNEMAYARSWPMKIWFYCVTAAERGGETPIADSRKVFARIDPQVRESFIEKSVMYVRNYDEDGLDLSWSTVFQTTDRLEVEAFCRRAGIEFEWCGRARLRTRQVCQAAAVHPRTGEQVWFNQAHLFHVSNLESLVREALSATYAEEDYPRNAYYGDGSPIEPEALAAIREAYAQETITFPWQEGDVLMLDNMLMAHGRKPFEGARRVVVGMAQSSE
ncbi:MAG TPA: TauD/TfdA family dioxygenase [Pyrinomonadaceae bacterium]